MKRAMKFLFRGEMRTVRELSEMSGIHKSTLNYRMREKKMTAEEAVGLGIGVPHRAKYPQRAKPAARNDEPGYYTDGMSKPENARRTAALKIASGITGDNQREFGFRTSDPMAEYMFAGDILEYRIRFAPNGQTATLTARYKARDIQSSLCRTYRVSGDKIKEVQPKWTP